MKLDQDLVDKIINNALKEDLGDKGDITTKAVFPEERIVKAKLSSRNSGIAAGVKIAQRVFELIDPTVSFFPKVVDGEAIRPDQILASIEGPVQSILVAERTALNFIQHLSGIATLTRQFVDKVKGLRVEILDTRKTTPGLRILEKYAVVVGGGKNHRFGLYDGVLIKDNHVKVAGGLPQAVKNVRENLSSEARVEVEADNIEQVREAIEAGADVIMLDNMDVEAMKQAVEMIDRQALVEASGGVTLENVLEVAKTGVDWISIGRLTQAPFLEMSLEVVGERSLEPDTGR